MARFLSPRIAFREFATQYLVGYFISLVAAVAMGVALQRTGASAASIAIATNIAATVVWYAYVVLYYLAGRVDLKQALRNLISDFGAAELLDFFVVRPGLLYLLPMYTHNQASGIVVASILADVVYTAIGLNRQRHRTLG